MLANPFAANLTPNPSPTKPPFLAQIIRLALDQQ